MTPSVGSRDIRMVVSPPGVQTSRRGRISAGKRRQVGDTLPAVAHTRLSAQCKTSAESGGWADRLEGGTPLGRQPMTDHEGGECNRGPCSWVRLRNQPSARRKFIGPEDKGIGGSLHSFEIRCRMMSSSVCADGCRRVTTAATALHLVPAQNQPRIYLATKHLPSVGNLSPS